jgi:hypothetical protein
LIDSKGAALLRLTARILSRRRFRELRREGRQLRHEIGGEITVNERLLHCQRGQHGDKRRGCIQQRLVRLRLRSLELFGWDWCSCGIHGFGGHFDLADLSQELCRERAPVGDASAEFTEATDLACTLGAHGIARGVDLCNERGSPRAEGQGGMLAEEFTDPVEQLEAAFGSGFHTIAFLLFVPSNLASRLGSGGAWFGWPPDGYG